MNYRIGLISDVHASPQPLKEALGWFHAEQVDRILCGGDIAGYFDQLEECIALLQEHDVQCIVGNHDQTWLQHSTDASTSAHQYLANLPACIDLRIGNQRLYLVHAEPPDRQHGGIKLLDQQGQLIEQQRLQWQQRLAAFETDLLIVGHTHQVYAEWLGDTLVINPGSSIFNHSCMIVDLPGMTVHQRALDGKEIIPCWHFGHLYGEGATRPKAGSY